MSTIKTVMPENATGEIAEIYNNIKKSLGFIPGAIVLFSANPFVLKQQVEYIGNFMQHKNISGELAAALRMMVSQTTKCEYCIDRNAGMLINNYKWTQEQVKSAKENFNNSPLSEKDRALLGIALKAVKDSNSVSNEDIESLRKSGWNDSDIFDAVNYAARMVSTDILINAFKVDGE